MQILVNLTFGELMNEFIIRFIISIFIFIAGIYLIRWYARKKEWDGSTRTAFMVSLLWLIINIPFELFILYFLGNNLIFDPLRIVIEILISRIVVAMYYNKKFAESLIFTIIIQALFYIIATIIGFLLGVLITMTTSDNDDSFSAGLGYFLCTMIMIGIIIFYVNWGDKMQFVKEKNLIILIVTIPGLFYLTDLFNSQGEMFIRNLGNNMFMGIIISLISSTVGRIIAQKTVSFEEYRVLDVLEKDKKILEVTDLKVYYALLGGVLKRSFGSVKAVDGVTFTIKTGETVGLVGESGCGKTTVANAILGLVPKEAGEILFNNEPIPNEYSKFLRRKIQIVFQDPDASLNPRMKIVDIIAEPLRNLLGITKKDEMKSH
ncbi:hypothetical protein ES705_38920 [subsurface metagenome]